MNLLIKQQYTQLYLMCYIIQIVCIYEMMMSIVFCVCHTAFNEIQLQMNRKQLFCGKAKNKKEEEKTSTQFNRKHTQKTAVGKENWQLMDAPLTFNLFP